MVFGVETSGSHARLAAIVTTEFETDRMPVVTYGTMIEADWIAGFLQTVTQFQVFMSIVNKIFIEQARIQQCLTWNRSIAGQKE